MAADLTAEEEARFDAFMERNHIAAPGMPPELAAQIRAGLHRRFHSPATANLEACLGHAITTEQARQLLFFPSAQDMPLYVKLLALPPAPATSDQEHPQFKVMVVALTMMFMVHCKHLPLMRPFIEAGGLLALVRLLAHPNLHVASQTLNILLLIAGGEVYDWHPQAGTRSAREGSDRQLWSSMFELCRSPLLSCLLRLQPDVFPGSSLLALRMLAFYTSWVRYNFTPARALCLSPDLLEVLRVWSLREGLGPEEKELIDKVYTDFSRFPAAAHPSLPLLSPDPDLTTVSADMPSIAEEEAGGEGEAEAEEEQEEELGVRVVADRTQVNTSGGGGVPEAEKLREAGNLAYKQGRYTQAIQLYSEAMDIPVPSAALITEGERRAVYHVNRAAAYLARGAAEEALTAGRYDERGLLEGMDHGDPSAVERHWLAALLDAESALELNPVYVRAHLRRTQALQRLNRLDQALAAAQLGLRHATRPAAAGSAAAAGSQRQLAAELQALVTQLSIGGTVASVEAPIQPESQAQQQRQAQGPLISEVASPGPKSVGLEPEATRQLLEQLLQTPTAAAGPSPGPQKPSHGAMAPPLPPAQGTKIRGRVATAAVARAVSPPRVDPDIDLYSMD